MELSNKILHQYCSSLKENVHDLFGSADELSVLSVAAYSLSITKPLLLGALTHKHSLSAAPSQHLLLDALERYFPFDDKEILKHAGHQLMNICAPSLSENSWMTTLTGEVKLPSLDSLSTTVKSIGVSPESLSIADIEDVYRILASNAVDEINRTTPELNYRLGAKEEINLYHTSAWCRVDCPSACEFLYTALSGEVSIPLKAGQLRPQVPRELLWILPYLKIMSGLKPANDLFSEADFRSYVATRHTFEQRRKLCKYYRNKNEWSSYV